MHGWWDGLNCWFERRPVGVRLGLVVLASLALWAVILLAAASLLA
ncbi:hypothetical protein [Roseomonas fluvialis]|nr:hypothetical protein [Roseomonas fluvialis]